MSGNKCVERMYLYCRKKGNQKNAKAKNMPFASILDAKNDKNKYISTYIFVSQKVNAHKNERIKAK